MPRGMALFALMGIVGGINHTPVEERTEGHNEQNDRGLFC